MDARIHTARGLRWPPGERACFQHPIGTPGGSRAGLAVHQWQPGAFAAAECCRAGQSGRAGQGPPYPSGSNLR